MKKIWTILPVIAATAAAPAFAQTVGFSPRIEVRAGHDELRADVEIEDSALTDDTSENGISYGLEGGLDYFGSTFLVGVYAGLDFSDINDCSRLFVDDFDQDEACINAGSNLTAGIRAGIPFSEGNFYVKGGYSRARIEASYFNEFDGELFNDSERVGGYHLGAGVELGLGRLGLGDNVYIKGEYVYTNYKKMFTDDLGQGESFDPSRHQLLAGVGLRFGGRADPVVIAPPPPPPAPPVEAAPATQTCADGTVILATDACPAPPPAPVPAPERG